MARSVQHANDRVAQRQLLTVIQRLKRESDFRRAVKTIGRAKASGEQTSTRSMVRVHVGVKYVRNLQSFFCSERDVGFDVTLLRVDDRALPNGPSAKGVGRATCVEIVKGFENHCGTPQFSARRTKPVFPFLLRWRNVSRSLV